MSEVRLNYLIIDVFVCLHVRCACIRILFVELSSRKIIWDTLAANGKDGWKRASLKNAKR